MHQDGRVFHSELQSILDGFDVVGGVGFALDITDRVRSEEETRAAEAEAHLLVERLTDTVEVLHATDQARRALVRRLVAAREEEHRQLATDVHDGPVQKLVAADLRLQMFQSRARLSAADEQSLKEITRVLSTTIAEMRQLLLELIPPALETHGLAAALGVLLEKMRDTKGLSVTLDDQLSSEPAEPWRTVCYRIAERRLRSIAKEGEATSLSVVLDDVEGELHMRITDDGVGVDVREEGVPGQPALESMRERAELAGGRLEISSGPGGGTIVDCWIPTNGSSV